MDLATGHALAGMPKEGSYRLIPVSAIAHAEDCHPVREETREFLFGRQTYKASALAHQ